jgi:hypothetical protein
MRPQRRQQQRGPVNDSLATVAQQRQRHNALKRDGGDGNGGSNTRGVTATLATRQRLRVGSEEVGRLLRDCVLASA